VSVSPGARLAAVAGLRRSQAAGSMNPASRRFPPNRFGQVASRWPAADQRWRRGAAWANSVDTTCRDYEQALAQSVPGLPRPEAQCKQHFSWWNRAPVASCGDTPGFTKPEAGRTSRSCRAARPDGGGLAASIARLRPPAQPGANLTYFRPLRPAATAAKDSAWHRAVFNGAKIRPCTRTWALVSRCSIRNVLEAHCPERPWRIEPQTAYSPPAAARSCNAQPVVLDETPAGPVFAPGPTTASWSTPTELRSLARPPTPHSPPPPIPS